MKKLSISCLSIFFVLQSLSSFASKIQIFKESFEPTNWFQWTSIQGGYEASSCGYYAYQDAMYFSDANARYAETVDLNLTYVDEVSFQLFISYYSAPGCDVAGSGNDITLDYSTDGGQSWTNVQTYKPSYSYAYFYAATALLPTAAKKANVRLRWNQVKFNGSGYDVWALDEIEMYQNCTAVSVPTITANGNIQFCNNDTLVLTAASQSSSFLWSTAETTQSIQVTSIGGYYVMSPDQNGCIAISDTLEITSAKPSIIAYAEDPSVCTAGNTQLNVAMGGNYTESFDPINKSFWNTISLGSVETSCGNSSNALFFYEADTYYADRYAITNDLDLTGGGDIEFDLYIDYTYTCEAADYGEDIYFDYSTDGGLNWTNLGVYYASTADYDPFATVKVSLPAAAQTSHTSLRWYQIYYSCSYCDYWGLDNIKISTLDTNISSKPYTYSWSPATGLSSTTVANPTVTAVNSNIVYTVTVTDTLTGCANIDTVSVNVFTPTTASITLKGSTTICPQDTAAITANAAKYYLWSNGATGQTAYVSDAGTYSVLVTYPGGCTSTSNSITITEYPTVPPTITASGPLDFCYNDSVVLTSSSSLAYMWSTGEATKSITVHNTGNYTVKGFDTYGCFLLSDTVNVVNHGPVTRIVADTTAICKGGSLQLSVKIGGSNYEEDFEPTIDNSFWTSTSNGYVGKSCGGSTKAIYFYGAGNYMDDRYAITKDLDLALDGTIQFDLYIAYNGGSCEAVDWGKDVYLDYSTDGGNTWTNIETYYAGYNTYDPFATITVPIPSGATDKTRLRWSQAYYDCISCDYWGLDNIKINTTDTSVFNNTYTYAWTPAAKLSDASIQNPIATINNTTTFTVTVVDMLLGCSGTDTFKLSTFNTPTTIITNTNSTICQGDTIKLESTYGESYQWSTGDTTQVIYVSQQGDYSVKTTFAGGCTASDTASLATVVPVFASINANGPTSFCQGGSVQLTATSGTAYQWSNGYTSQSITATESGNYFVTVYDANSCLYKTSPVTVINADPAVTIVEDSTSVCKGTVLHFETESSVDFEEDFDNFKSKLWANYTGYVGTYCFYTTSSIYFYYGTQRYIETVDLNLSKGGTVQFDLYIDNYYYCDPAETGDDVVLEYSTDGGQTWTTLETYYAGTSTYAYFTTVTASVPVAAQTYATKLRWVQYTFDGDWYDVWGIDNVSILNPYKDGYTYSWTPTDGLSSSTSETASATIDTTITYTLAVTDTASGCMSTNSITIIGKDVPKAQFTYTINGLAVSFTNSSTYSDSYYWIFGDGSVSFNQDVTHTYPSKGTYEVILKSKGDCGYDYDTVMVNVGTDGIEDLTTGTDFSIYPNPTKANITVEWKAASNEEINIQILSINGELIKETRMLASSTRTTIDMNDLSKGIYFIKLITNTQTERQKVVLN